MESGTKLILTGKVEKFYEKLVPVLRKFPKTQRYTLAENIEKETLHCVRLIFQAAYQKSDRSKNLEQLRINLHLINFLLRAAYTQNFISDKVYEELTTLTVEMGKIASQWIKNEGRPAKKTTEPAPSIDQTSP